MPSAENAKLQYEAGQDQTAMSALTDSGDHTKFTSAETLWSGRSGFAPDVRPDGLITGGEVIPAVAAGNDNVDVAALSCYVQGVKLAVSASTDDSITRPATALAKINSITVTSGGAVAVVAGTDSADTTFSEVRAAAGGPPLIPVTSIEIAQVRVVSDTAAVITADQIKVVPGVHMERYDYPSAKTVHYGGYVRMAAVLPLSHTGDVPKNIYASYAGPVLADLEKAYDFVPSANSYTVNSEQVYGDTIGSSSSTLNQGTFEIKMNNAISDALAKLEGINLWFKFFPDRYQTPYLLDQGKLGMSKAFPAGDNISASCTISVESAHVPVDA